MTHHQPRLSYRRETPWGEVRVTEDTGLRRLYLGERVLQSAMDPAHPERPVLEYTRAMLAALLFQPLPKAALLLGLGGGDMARFLAHHLPRISLTAVELNRAVIEAARRHFVLPPEPERLKLVTADALTHMARQKRRYDLILADLNLGGQGLDTLDDQAFLRHCRRALRPGGVVAINLLPLGSEEFTAFLITLRRVFEHATLCLAVPGHHNVIAFGFADVPLALDHATLHERAARLEREYGMEFTAQAEGLVRDNPTTAGRFLF